MAFFVPKKGQDLENQVAHPYHEFLGVPLVIKGSNSEKSHICWIILFHFI